MKRLTASSLLLALLLAGDAPAAGGLQVSPARIDARVAPGDRLPPVRVSNRSDQPLDVRLHALRSGQELAGTPDARLSPEAIAAGAGFLRLRPERMRLGPGEEASVRATVTGGPTAGAGSYGVIVAAASPAAGKAADGPVLDTQVRLSVNVLLRYAGDARADGAAEALRAEQGGDKVLRFVARIRNSGTLHGRPRTRLTVLDGSGGPVLQGRFPAGAVLPGAVREFPLDVANLLGPGTYTARLQTTLGKGTNTIETPFTLVGPNQLPTPDLRITRLDPPAAEPGEPYTLRVGLRNAGTAAVAPQGEVTLAGRLVREVVPGLLEPGRETDWADELPGVPAGTHELRVAFKDGDRVVAERTVVFTTGATRGWADRVQDWLAGHVPLVVAVFLVVLALGGALALTRIRRLQRRLRQLGASGRAG